MKINFIKGLYYMTNNEKYGQKEMKCFEKTEDYAFLAPVVDDNTLDLTQVSVYSAKEGDTPIESIISYKEA